MNGNILSLPNELLLAIAAAGQHTHSLYTPTAQKSEWILSRLSHRFRNVITSAPTLWANIQASLDSLETRQGLGEILRLYLRRSIPINVSVSLKVLIASDVLRTEWLPDIASAINRVERLYVVLSSEEDDLGDEFMPLRYLAAPNLRHLEIANVNVQSKYRCAVQLFSAGAPKLSSVRMCGFFPAPPPSWKSALTHLVIDNQGHIFDTDDEVMLSILKPPISLVCLCLDLSALPSAHQICIPSLKDLSLHLMAWQDVEYFEEIIDLIECPALTTLTIVGSHGDQVYSLLYKPRPSFPALNTVTFTNDDHFNGCGYGCENDVPFSPTTRPLGGPPSFPALSSLVLVNHCFMWKLVREILGPNPPPLPQLETLTLCPTVGIPDVRHALQDVVRNSSRRLPKLRLSPSVYFWEDWGESRADVEVLGEDEIVGYGPNLEEEFS
ncbi:hypothetical protein R3P38DRAFT_2853779 [Favolaschia claudopus]|uniref:F-box domain-containing protein n=1 Tax=Favolaschia claudopus TaxID=2862362 RepID=A0AAW0DRL9_9AGAR